MKKIYFLFVLLNTICGLSQSGILDTTFGTAGKVTTAFGYSSATANAVAVQPDGKIIVGGKAYTANAAVSWEIDTDNSVLVRYNPDGTKDATFGNKGIVMTDLYPFYLSNGWSNTILSIKILPDGKFLTYGFSQFNYGGSALIIRYNPDGSVDSGFGNNGQLSCNSGAVEGNNSLVIQPDGKLVILGVQTLQNQGNYSSQFVVERYSENGVADTTFGTEGRVVTGFGPGYDVPRAMALQPDGKILVAGSTYNYRFALVRYTTTGELDTTFDTDGKVITSFGTGINALGYYMSLRADGKIVMAGATGSAGVNSFAVARYNSNGSLDTTFDTDGKATNVFDPSDPSFNIVNIMEQPDEKFLVLTSADPYGSLDQANDAVTRRFNSNATTDTSFGINGKNTHTFEPGFNTAKNLTLQADGKILVTGFSRPVPYVQNTFPNFDVLRLLGDGNVDSTFGSNGQASARFDSSNDECTILLRQSNDKLISIGITKNHWPNGYWIQEMAVSRHNTDGSPDETFGTSGKINWTFDNKPITVVKGVLQPDEKLLVAFFYAGPDNTAIYELIRFNSNGTVDMTFGTNGRVPIDSYSDNVLCQSDGKIIVLSYEIDTILAKRYLSTGLPDTSFGTNGTASWMGNYISGTRAVIQPDDKILIATTAPDSNGLSGLSAFRFNANGSVDTGFSNEVTSVDNGCYLNAVFVQPDGKIVLTGESVGFSDGTPVYQFAVVRFNADGSPDTTNTPNGVTTSYLGSSYEPWRQIRSVLLQPDGKTVLAMTRYEGLPASINWNSYDFVIRRFDINGNTDPDFGANGQITTGFYNKYDEAFAMVLQSDNKIVVAGTTDTGINRDFALVRYENTIELSGDDFEMDNKLILYPNPAKDILYVKSSQTNNASITKIIVYNLTGQTVLTSDNANSAIDISQLQTGLYHIQVKTNSGNWSGKFIKE